MNETAVSLSLLRARTLGCTIREFFQNLLVADWKRGSFRPKNLDAVQGSKTRTRILRGAGQTRSFLWFLDVDMLSRCSRSGSDEEWILFGRLQGTFQRHLQPVFLLGCGDVTGDPLSRELVLAGFTSGSSGSGRQFRFEPGGPPLVAASPGYRPGIARWRPPGLRGPRYGSGDWGRAVGDSGFDSRGGAETASGISENISSAWKTLLVGGESISRGGLTGWPGPANGLAGAG